MLFRSVSQSRYGGGGKGQQLSGSGGGRGAVSGSANTGGGGGGYFNSGSGSGGSGIVVLRYSDAYTITFGAGVTPTESAASGGYKRATITAATAGNVSWT